MRNGHRNLWMTEEDNQLRELITSKASPTLMSAKLRRSSEAIRMRCMILRKRQATNPDGPGRKVVKLSWRNLDDRLANDRVAPKRLWIVTDHLGSPDTGRGKRNREPRPEHRQSSLRGIPFFSSLLMDLFHHGLKRAPANLTEVAVFIRYKLLAVAGSVDADVRPSQVVVCFAQTTIANEGRFRAHGRLEP